MSQQRYIEAHTTIQVWRVQANLHSCRRRFQILIARRRRTADALLYHQAVGCLIFLCNLRPDIRYAVSQSSRFMHSPATKHIWQAAKQVFSHYLKGTMNFSLFYWENKSSCLTQWQLFNDRQILCSLAQQEAANSGHIKLWNWISSSIQHYSTVHLAQEIIVWLLQGIPSSMHIQNILKCIIILFVRRLLKL